MNVWAIIPVKSLRRTKSRLAGVLTAAERAALTRRLLRRELAVLAGVRGLAGVLVVSRDTAVQTIAAAQGASILAETPGGGLNDAVGQGAGWVHEHGGMQALILPSDLPFVTVDDVVVMLAAGGGGTAVLCSDRHGEGTNGLLVPVGSGFRFRYGAGSFRAHQAEAARLGLACQVATAAGLQFDLDTAVDWAIYREAARAAAHH